MTHRPEDARVLAERDIMPARGPSFFREGGEVLFRFVIDTANIIGPRPASRRDQEEHPGAWAAFCAAEDVSALDRDADGQDGGSLTAEPATQSGGGLPEESPEAAPAEPPKRKTARRRRA